MKNPLAYLKHIVKDPITTVAEADARKKEIMPLLYGSAGVMALGVILQIAAKLDFMVALSFVGLIGAGFCGFLLFVIKSAKQKFEALTCYNCNTMAEIKTGADFAKYISYTVEKDEAVYKGSGAKVSPTNGVYSLVKITARSSAVVSVRLTCPHCGQVKHLKYSAEPFGCHAEQKNVRTIDYEIVYSRLDTAVKAAVEAYNDPERRERIPYTFHSSKNPNFERRYEFKGANASDAHPEYMGVRIDYHKDVEEMLAHYFVLNELSGTLSDPNPKPQKKGAAVVAAPSAGEACETPGENREGQPSVNTSAAEPAAEDRPAEESVPTAAEETVVPEAENPPVEEAAPAAAAETAAPEIHIAAPAVPEAEKPPVEEAAPAVTAVAPAPDTQNSQPTLVAVSAEAEAEKQSGLRWIAIAVAAICVVLLLGGIILALVITRSKQDAGQETSMPTTQATTLPDETEQTTVPTTRAFYASDYVGYWHAGYDSAAELTIHSGDADSIVFSLWYDPDTMIENVNAQLLENVASFSLAVNGAVVKGKLTFEDTGVILQITQSTLDAIPAETLEFTVQDMVSWITTETQTTPTATQPALPFNEVPYTVKVNASSDIYGAPSYASAYVDVLPVGTYTIVAEEYDAHNNLWGKLKSGVGWVCVTAIKTYEDETPLEPWQAAYLELLETMKSDSFSYALVYVDEDPLPELYIGGDSEAMGDSVYIYRNGVMVEQHLSRCRGGRYIEYGGLILNRNGNMGYYYTDIYSLDENGFTNVFSGAQEEVVALNENGGYDISYKYDIAGREVSEEEFNAAVAAIFDDSYAVEFHANTVSYDQIVHDIQSR